MAAIQLQKEKIDLGLLRDAVYPKPSRLLTVSATIGQSEPMKVLVDGAAQLNLLSAVIAKEQGLEVTPLPEVRLGGVDGGELRSYGYTVADVSITDSRGRTRTHCVCFIVADMAKYQMYLGLPWIDEYNPKVNLRSRRLLFRGDNARNAPKFEQVAIESAEEFDRTMRSSTTDVYALIVNFVGSLNQEGTERAHIGHVGPIAGSLPSVYKDYAEVASEEDSSQLAEHSSSDLAIKTLPDAQIPHHPLYSLSTTELQVLRKYVDDMLSKGWIRRSKSPAGAPVLFAKKKDGGLRLCVDYRGLNKVTIKNRHPLPLINESLDRLGQAKCFTKLDIRDAYHRIRIKEGDEWKTAFRTKYGHFEYTVMPFGLTNAPAQFQAYIMEALAGLVDVSCIVYLDDILIYSESEEAHVSHVKEVLERLRKYKLYIKLSKCEWHATQTEYLGYIVSPEGISVDRARVETVQEWPMPISVREVRVFLGFMNYYRRFIARFSQIALPLTSLTQKSPNAARGGPAQRREESVKIQLNDEAKKAFQLLKDAFIDSPILAHFEFQRDTRAEVDASRGAICGILSQYVLGTDGKGQWRPIDFFSRKLIQAEYNYDTHDQELLAIVKSLKHWRHYLEGIRFEILTDHNNLRWFMETKVLNHRQVRSYLELTRYDFVITHRPGATNPADGPSRRPDYMAEAQEPVRKYNEAFVKPMSELLSRKSRETPALVAVVTRSRKLLGEHWKEFSEAEKVATEPKEDVEDRNESDYATSDSDDSDREEKPQNKTEIPLNTAAGLIHLTTVEEKAEALDSAHNHPMAGHFGPVRTLEKLRRKYTWKGIRKDVEEYCRACLKCRKSTAARHRPYGLLQPLAPPTRAWQEVTMDFITELPPSKFTGVTYDAILVIVDRLTKMAHYVPARGDWDGYDLAQTWLREVVRLHGVPEKIISDRGPLMNSKHWRTFNYYLNARRILSTAFHPQTDGQTERQNQTLEQYLRCFCVLEQDDWTAWLSIAEFAYNDSVHATTKDTPFRANQGIDPRGPVWPSCSQTTAESPSAKSLASKVIDIQKECQRNIIKANEYSKQYQDSKRLPSPFKVGDKVLLSTKNIASIRPKKKLDWKYLGPGTITEQLSQNVYKIDMPGLRSVHPVFHASLLDHYDPKCSIPSHDKPIEDVMYQEGDDVYEVEDVVDRRQNKAGRWEYLIKWKGYPPEENSWEPTTNLSAPTVKKFWSEIKPRRGRGRPPRKKGDNAV